jgi:hypothetical protein
MRIFSNPKQRFWIIITGNKASLVLAGFNLEWDSMEALALAGSAQDDVSDFRQN